MQQELETHHHPVSGGEAAAKIREIVKHARYCLFGTDLAHPPVTVCPMTVQNVDDAGALWFLSGRSTRHNQQMAADHRVQLFFVNPDKSEFMTLDGEATIHDDRATREAHWTPFAKTWFNEGIDDPELTVIQVTPRGGYYWDTKHGKTVSFLKSTAGMLIGKTLDDSLEGQVRP